MKKRSKQKIEYNKRTTNINTDSKDIQQNNRTKINWLTVLLGCLLSVILIMQIYMLATNPNLSEAFISPVHPTVNYSSFISNTMVEEIVTVINKDLKQREKSSKIFIYCDSSPQINGRYIAGYLFLRLYPSTLVGEYLNDSKPEYSFKDIPDKIKQLGCQYFVIIGKDPFDFNPVSENDSVMVLKINQTSFDKSIIIYNDEYDLMQKANQLFKKNDYDQASKIYQNLYNHHIQEWGVYYNLGVCYEQTNQYQKAIPFFTLAIQNMKNHSYSYYNRGICYFYMHKYIEAYQDFEMAQKLQPNDTNTINMLNSTKEMIEKSKGA